MLDLEGELSWMDEVGSTMLFNPCFAFLSPFTSQRVLSSLVLEA